MQSHKYRRCLQMLYISLVTVFVMSGCTKEDLSSCASESYTLAISAVDIEGGELTAETVKEVMLYVFDENNQYLGVHTGAQIGKKVALSYPKHEKLTIVAWGNGATGHQTMPTLTVGDNIETAFVSLIQTRAALPIAQSPDDLFYGSIILNKENLQVGNTIPIRRKTASVIITARKLKQYVSATDDDFSYVLRKSTNKLDFYGKPNGTDVSYRPEAVFDNTRQFVSPIFNIFSTTTNIEIDIYHGSVLIATVVGDSDGKPFKAVEGKLLNVLIDFSSDVSVSVSVTGWGKQQIWKEF
ncbi:FimB/Mfa2 family fimbrial subunit [Bacteroides sp.]|uniref:FimB/Mfa2 family fimbrial subunit n=1 Tax=Bacteroides sp. TaxID=29523 RepID=UPI002FC8B9E9